MLAAIKRFMTYSHGSQKAICGKLLFSPVIALRCKVIRDRGPASTEATYHKDIADA
jgi:hypothetical protein